MERMIKWGLFKHRKKRKHKKMEYLFMESIGEDALVQVYADELTGAITRIILKGSPKYTLWIGDAIHKTGAYITPTDLEKQITLDPTLSSKISTKSGSLRVALEGGSWR